MNRIVKKDVGTHGVGEEYPSIFNLDLFTFPPIKDLCSPNIKHSPTPLTIILDYIEDYRWRLQTSN